MISVFGSTGFIGSHFCELYRDDALPVERGERCAPTNEILYFISTTDNYNVFSDMTLDVRTNLLVLMETIAALKGTSATFNFISSWFVYGDTELPAKENSYCDPKGFYSITKKCAEDLLISFCNTFGVSYRILRLCNVYGTGDLRASKKKNALQFLIEKMRKGEDIGLYHGGDFLRDYMHVNDVCRAINLVVCSGAKNQIYNIGSGKAIKFKDVIDLAHATLGSTSTITSVQPPEFHQAVQVRNMQLDTTKLEELGFTEETSIEEGVTALCR